MDRNGLTRKPADTVATQELTQNCPALEILFNILHFTNNYVPGDVLGTDNTKIGKEQNLSKSQCPSYNS